MPQVSPYPSGYFLNAEQGGTGTDPTMLGAGLALVTTGIPSAPLMFQATLPGEGTVTSVGLALPATFTVTGSPVATAGTLTAAYATQAAALVFAGPTNGAAAVPTFRALVSTDLPPLNYAALVVTTVAVTPASAVAVSSGLSLPVIAGATYAFEIYVYSEISAVANSTVSLNFGTATVTSLIGFGSNILPAGQQNGTSLTAYASTLNSTLVTAEMICQCLVGTFVVNASGTFVPGYATAATSTDSLLPGSWMRLTRIS